MEKPEQLLNKRSQSRTLVMIETGISMMLHNKLRLMATLAGVLFAVLLSNFALGTFLGLVQKNLMLPQNANADLWILPKGFRQFGAGDPISTVGVEIALGLPEVKEVRPMLFGTRTLDALGGKREAIQIIGTQYPYELGGPWNFVVGNRDVLQQPDTMILENSMRPTFGNLNLRDIRELSGRRITVGGFTRGLLPFGPPFSFADFELARELLGMPRDRTHFVLVTLNNLKDLETVKSQLMTSLPETDVLSKSELNSVVVKFLLTATPIGVTFGAISFFGILVGTVIVSLTMFQTVADNLKEFGTLKAVGANMKDLTILMYTQAALNSVIGSLLGVSVVGALAAVMRNPKLALYLPLPLTLGTFIVMSVVCFVSASIALLKLRKVEPGMVFR